jgi:hypothetical protein
MDEASKLQYLNDGLKPSLHQPAVSKKQSENEESLDNVNQRVN